MHCCTCPLSHVVCTVLRSKHLFLPLQSTMPGMKRDCGGAAAILGAFKATVKQVKKMYSSYICNLGSESAECLLVWGNGHA